MAPLGPQAATLLILLVVATGTAPANGLPTGATEQDVAQQYEQLGEHFQELRESYGPLASNVLHSQLPGALEDITQQVQTFVEKLEWAPSLSSIGRLIDQMAWGTNGPQDPRTGDKMAPSDCGDSESCQQVIGAVKEITGVFKGTSMLYPPFFRGDRYPTPQPSPAAEPLQG